MKHIPIKIPVKAHVYKYLLYHFGPQMKLSLQHTLGEYVFSILQNNVNEQLYQDRSKDYPHTYTILIPEKLYFDRGAKGFSAFAIIRFNGFVDKQLKKELRIWLDSQKITRQNFISDYIKDFMLKYQIDESDFTFEGFKKDYYRYRKKAQEKVRNFSRNLPLHCPDRLTA